MLHDIWKAEKREDAEKAFDLFVKTYKEKFPDAVALLLKDRRELMAFDDFPAANWQSIRTTNPIESAFATIRHRTKRATGCLSRDCMLQMMFKLGQCAQDNWRKLRGFAYLAEVIQGINFKDGIIKDLKNADLNIVQMLEDDAEVTKRLSKCQKRSHT